MAACIGVILIYSATRSKKLVLAWRETHYFLTRQAAYVAAGVLVMAVMAALDYHWLEHASAVLYVGIDLALLAMFMASDRVRWAPPVGSKWLRSRSSRPPSAPSCSS